MESLWRNGVQRKATYSWLSESRNIINQTLLLNEQILEEWDQMSEKDWKCVFVTTSVINLGEVFFKRDGTYVFFF